MNFEIGLFNGNIHQNQRRC